MLFQLGILFLLSQGLFAESEKPDGDTRILGGRNAPEGFAKYQVSIRKKPGKNEWHHCGGSILNEEWVLTAAHCTYGIKMSELSIMVGTNKLQSGGTRYKIKKMISHEKYAKKDLRNDIALIQIDGKIAMTDNVKAIKLKKEAVSVGTKCTLTGWGYTNNYKTVPNDLQYLEFTTISNKECNDKLKKFAAIDEKQICVKRPEGKGACNGDSGGPLVVADDNKEFVQIGVVSWGINPCGKQYPDVFASVSGYYDWIEKNMK
ncbi:chymotrypsin-2-like [Pieris rapae]|uniref:chymotrypsin-2-like n=1 Tax=Pieris rapae TaxID=64459 RepID=UPI001E27D47B|nr:chymotrypsin-2-like [Pieris rapae]